MDFKLGQIVYSKMGRDSGRKMIIYEIINEDYVLVVDGVLRKVCKPKKKKKKHLQPTNNINESILEKFLKKEKIFDSDIRKALEVR